MAFELPPLPWAKDSLAPHISEETIDYHYGKHHRAYVNKLNDLIKGSEMEKMSLEQVIKKTSTKKTKEETQIFNNAAQDWNHTFYWHCLSPHGGGEPKEELK